MGQWVRQHLNVINGAGLAHLERHGTVAAATGSWMTCSVGMLVFNKLAVQSFPLPCLLVAIQMLFSSLAMLVFCRQSLHIGSMREVLRWCAVVPFFLGMLLTSMFALKTAPMSLVITFRALSPCISLAAERFYPNPPKVKLALLGPLLVIAVGAGLYAKDMVNSGVSVQGIGWVFLNSFFAVGDRLLQFLFLNKEQNPVDISKTGVTLINNLVGFFPVLLVGLLVQEHLQVQQVLAAMNWVGMLWLFLSCVVGVLISYTGVVVSSMISATSFLVLINANKFLIILLEVTYLHGSHRLTGGQITGAMLALIGSIIWTVVKEEDTPKLGCISKTETTHGRAENRDDDDLLDEEACEDTDALIPKRHATQRAGVAKETDYGTDI